MEDFCFLLLFLWILRAGFFVSFCFVSFCFVTGQWSDSNRPDFFSFLDDMQCNVELFKRSIYLSADRLRSGD